MCVRSSDAASGVGVGSRSLFRLRRVSGRYRKGYPGVAADVRPRQRSLRLSQRCFQHLVPGGGELGGDALAQQAPRRPAVAQAADKGPVLSTLPAASAHSNGAAKRGARTCLYSGRRAGSCRQAMRAGS